MCKRSDVLSRPVLMVRGLDGYFDLPSSRSALRRRADRSAVQFSRSGEGPTVSPPFGGDSEEDTPLPIPNREVKPLSADGTWASRPWESRSPPVFVLSRLGVGAAVIVWAASESGGRLPLAASESKLPRRAFGQRRQ